MKVEICTLENKNVGEMDLSDSIFGAEIRRDILARVVRWQLAKRQSGAHKVKRRGELSYSHNKFRPQKGSGRSRQGYRGSTHFRGGATLHGPVVRSHAHSLPKKVRALGLISALSSRAKDGQLKIIETTDTAQIKTKEMAKNIQAFGAKSILFVEGQNVPETFARSISNLPRVNALPTMGINVYDILRHEQLVLSKGAVEKLMERLS